MNRISRLFETPSKKVIPFITAGYPDPKYTVNMVLAAEEAGASMVELGMPFSDPLADGPVIQHCSEVALQAGMNLNGILDIVQQIREKSNIPIILMGYLNPILKYGLRAFFHRCQLVGVDGFILPDLPPEEAQEYLALCKEFGLAPVLMVSPNTPAQRIEMISKLSGHLIYCTSILGITGSALDRSVLTDYLKRVRDNSTTPFVVGFGIRTSEDVQWVNEYSDGAVVGSALLKYIETQKNPVQATGEFVHKLRANNK